MFNFPAEYYKLMKNYKNILQVLCVHMSRFILLYMENAVIILKILKPV